MVVAGEQNLRDLKDHELGLVHAQVPAHYIVETVSHEALVLQHERLVLVLAVEVAEPALAELDSRLLELDLGG